jgi:hypothetical protein
MKRILLFIVLCVFSESQIAAQAQKLDWVTKVGAKQFPSGKKIYKVDGVSDTSTVITKEIQAAIDECAQKGGGIVIFAPGVYVCGSIS